MSQAELDDIPLLRRFPALRSIPRVRLCTLPSPVEPLTGISATLWIKRDDLNAPVFGGNKPRVLEFLLGRVQPGDTVVAVGGAGSTHVLATALHAARLGARTIAFRWAHDMNPIATSIAQYSAEWCNRAPVSRFSAVAIARAQLLRLLRRGVHYVPLGGSSPLGVLAQVNAGLELAEQIRDGLLPAPARIVVPLGSSGTSAGIALGLAIAGVPADVVGVRVAPRIAANRMRVLQLARATARLIERHTGERLPRVAKERVVVDHRFYAGAYGRPHPLGLAAARRLARTHDLHLDQTYSAKAFAAALDAAERLPGSTLFWLTFDTRVLTIS